MGRPRNSTHKIDLILDMVQKRFNLNRMGAQHQLGMTEATVSRVRTGKARVTPRIIMNIYDTLGLSIEEIRKILELDKP